MIDIQKRLETLFERERIIFWYDDNEALRSEFEEVQIVGVEKRVIDNNEFTLKREVLRVQPNGKFLIYSPNIAPNPDENWLLDLNIANHLFSADKISLVLQTLGLDVSYKSFMMKFEKFLNAKTRLETLSVKINKSETNESLVMKMISVAIGCEDNIESIFLKLLSDSKAAEIIEKFELKEELFKIIKNKYSYDGDNFTDLIYKLLQNHFYYYTDRTKCSLNSDARLFVNSWMDSSKYKNSFKEISNKVSNELNIKRLIESIEFKHLLNCDTYEKCDQVIISNLLDKLNNNTLILDDAKGIIQNRRNGFWFDNYQNIYNALLSAMKLIDFIQKETFEIEDFNDGIDKYSKHWYKADNYYREYCLYSSKAEHLELLKGLNVKIEDIYLNGYLRELGDTWQQYAQTYSVENISNHQQSFYKNYIQPSILKSQRIFVIISDALRYECGVELTSKIAMIDKYTTLCNHMVSSLPSYTQLGMASLLPHKTLKIGDKNDTVTIDDKSSVGTINRDKILKIYHEKSAAINYEEFLKFDRNEGREFSKEHEVIYIYHDEIDKMGEKNESKTFDAVESAFDTIIKIVKQIYNFNSSNVIVTSDHGFLYTNQPTLESEFCQVQSEGSIKTNRRFIMGQNLIENSCVVKFDSKTLGLEGENEFLIPKSINKIRLQGGGNRFVHGGATLQELVIPVIEIKKQRQENTKIVNVEIIPLRNITTNSVNVALYQTEAVNEKVQPITLKIAFESIDGKILSDEIKYTFDSNEQYDTNRETRLKLTFKQDVNEYNNKTIKLVARRVIDGSTETPLYKELETKLQLTFFNDFDNDF